MCLLSKFPIKLWLLIRKDFTFLHAVGGFSFNIKVLSPAIISQRGF